MSKPSIIAWVSKTIAPTQQRMRHSRPIVQHWAKIQTGSIGRIAPSSGFLALEMLRILLPSNGSPGACGGQGTTPEERVRIEFLASNQASLFHRWGDSSIHGLLGRICPLESESRSATLPRHRYRALDGPVAELSMSNSVLGTQLKAVCVLVGRLGSEAVSLGLWSADKETQRDIDHFVSFLNQRFVSS